MKDRIELDWIYSLTLLIKSSSVRIMSTLTKLPFARTIAEFSSFFLCFLCSLIGWFHRMAGGRSPM